MSTPDNPKKVRLELLDGTVEATGTDDFLRRAQALFAKLAGPSHDVVERMSFAEDQMDLGRQLVHPQVTATDIRSLRDQKQPRNQVEMAALVAYYVTEIAPEADRKPTIDSQDIKKYFGQASYQTSTAPRMVLSNAKTAGYLDSPSTGEYKLNPVGYNLVTAGLPAEGGPRRRRKRKAAKGGRKKR